MFIFQSKLVQLSSPQKSKICVWKKAKRPNLNAHLLVIHHRMLSGKRTEKCLKIAKRCKSKSRVAKHLWPLLNVQWTWVATSQLKSRIHLDLIERDLHWQLAVSEIQKSFFFNPQGLAIQTFIFHLFRAWSWKRKDHKVGQIWRIQGCQKDQCTKVRCEP